MIQALGSIAHPLPIATGDACFSGIGDNGSTILVTVERKKIGDLCQCILDGRYLHQLQIAKTNGADVFALIVEGVVRPSSEDGLLEIPVWGINPKTMRRCQMWGPVKPTTTYSRYDQYLTELDYLAGVIVKRSRDVQETASIIKALWDNFQTPPDKHNSLRQVFSPPNTKVELVRPSLLRRVVKELDGLGWERSKAVAEHFRTIRAMANADVAEWVKVDGIGKKTAEKVVRAIRGGTKC
jgi:ERCC4-type nuclease